MRKLFLAAALFLVLFIFSPKTIWAGPECTAREGTCKLNCESSEQSVGKLDCSGAPGKGPGESCCVPKTSDKIIAAACPGTCRYNECRTGESKFINKNTCDASGQVCCTTNPIVPNSNPTLGCPKEGEINTAIGCIPVNDTNQFVAFILRWAIGVGGGIAFLLIIVAGFQIMTSSGNPDRLKAGQELLTSAIAGLIMLIFSVFILKVIGIDILKLPGLT